jgi:formyltetrahydrofolate-dependent phosphoribosylglycinamide formyltransferase
MLNRLKKHWAVDNKQLFLILCTFAITGTLTAWLTKKVAEWLFFDDYGFAWWISKIVVLIFGYQVIILIVGFSLGMFPFFWKYEKKILTRFGLLKKNLNDEIIVENQKESAAQLAIFASGAGSNAQEIINYFRDSTETKIALIVCNNRKAGVIEIAAKENIPLLLIDKNKFLEHGYVSELNKYQIDLIILAGFLWKIPPQLINAFPNRIINIHPALLPAFGGKGMFGKAVHAAVVAAKEKDSGITIHYVDEKYDHGEIIFQTKCTIDENETAESLAQKIHNLEHQYYPKIIDSVLKKTFR